MSQGLLRARAPFRFRNAFTGLVVVSFAGLVYAYSISAVKQDDFSDVPIPTLDEIQHIQAELDEEKAALQVATSKALRQPSVDTSGPSNADGFGSKLLALRSLVVQTPTLATSNGTRQV